MIKMSLFCTLKVKYRISKKKDQRYENLSQEEYGTFINLIIQKAGKGNTVAIID